MALEGFVCWKCNRPFILSQDEIDKFPPRCPECPDFGTEVTVEGIAEAIKQAFENTNLAETFERLHEEGQRDEAARQADPEAVRVSARRDQEGHNEMLARNAPAGWSVTAIYVDTVDERGWFYSRHEGHYEVRAPDGSVAVLDTRKGAENQPGWHVAMLWMNYFPRYTITSPSGEVLTFGDDWNA